MKKAHSYPSDRQRSNGIRRQQPPPAWKRPSLWFRFIIVAISLNLFIAFVTIERHISFSTTASSSSSFQMDRPKIPKSSSQWKRGRSKAQFLTESRIWHRMLLQQGKEEEQTNNFFCSNVKNETYLMSTTNVANRYGELSPFGFPETVRAYVVEHENELSLSKGLSISSSSSSSMYCLAPPSEPSCQSFQYTVVIYSSGINRDGDEVRKDSTSSAAFGYRRQNNFNQYWRNIVVGTMKFLAYPSVQRVNLVLREQETRNNGKNISSVNYSTTNRRTTALEDSAKRNKYAKRVLNWSRKDVVNVVSAASLWDAIDRLEVPSESVLWIDGDHSNDSERKINNIANDTVLTHRFHVWREVPNALVIPKVTSIVPMPQPNINHTDDKHNARGSICTIPLLHEMMMHSSYLCFLNHPVVGSELRNYINSVRRRVKANDSTQKGYDNVSWDITTIAMSMFLFSIGDGYVIEGVNHSSADTTAYRPLSSLHSAAGDNDTLATYTKYISNYFGCPCSMSTPLLFPSNIRQCSSV